MRLAFVCDFDGTVSPTDVGAALVWRFTTDRGRVARLVERWRAGEIGTRDVIEGECATLRVSAAESLEFVRGFDLDPGFAPFARATLARGDRVMVVSEGYDFYLPKLLGRAGLGPPARGPGGRLPIARAAGRPAPGDDAVRIGPVQVDSPFLLAPLAGVSDSPFRRLAREQGAAAVYTEMVSADGLVRGNPG